MPPHLRWQSDWDDALRNYERGRFAEAAASCQRVLAARPKLIPALQLMGIAVCQTGQAEQGVQFLRRAVDASGQDADLWNDLGNAQRMARQTDDALRSFQQALRFDAAHVEALNNLGFTLYQAGQAAEAVPYLQRAIQLNPKLPIARNNLACALLDLKHVEEAIAVLKEAIRAAPSDVAAYVNLGDALRRAERLEEAESILRQALPLAPQHPELLMNLAGVNKDRGRLDEALSLLEIAMQTSPQNPQVMTNFGDALRRVGRWEEAEAVLRKALRLAPELQVAALNLGSVYRDLQRDEEAIDMYQKAMQLKPDYAEAHWDLSLTLLAKEELRRGWAEYQWRTIADTRTPLPPDSTPAWNGESLTGKRILLIAEQGMGDTIFFIRYAAGVRRAGAAEVIAAVQTPLVPLIQTCRDIDRVIPSGAEPPAHDVHCLLGSLPQFFSPTVEEIPREIPYLHVPDELVKKWEPYFAARDGFRIGIAWQGNPKYDADRFRSAPLDAFLPLAQLPGARLICLQATHGLEQLAAAQQRFPAPIEILPAERDTTAGAFMDTAAIMRHLDLVVSIDSALVHIAGAIGAPVWLSLGKVADWRWFRNRDDSPWYPTVRVFRQRHGESWEPVMQSIAAQISRSFPAISANTGSH